MLCAASRMHEFLFLRSRVADTKLCHLITALQIEAVGTELVVVGFVPRLRQMRKGFWEYSRLLPCSRRRHCSIPTMCYSVLTRIFCKLLASQAGSL